MNKLLKSVMKGKGAKVKMESRYTTMSSKRNSYLSKAEEYSRMTLPNIFPTDGEGTTDTQHGFDSTGAKITNHLVNKMVQTLFPAHLPFFKLEFSEEGRNALAQKAVDATKLQQLLAIASAQSLKVQTKNESRRANIEALKQLVIGGNTLIFAQKAKKVQAIPLNNYVLARNTEGMMIELITEQKKDIQSFPEALQTQIRLAMKAKGESDEKEVTMYTWVYFHKGVYTVAQIAYDILLEKAQEVDPDDLPWVPLAWNLAYGRDYGNGYVEDYSGDLYALEFLKEAETKGLVLMSDIKYMLKAGSITRPEDIFGTETGEVITGNRDDVSVLQLEKWANFEHISSAVDKITRSVSQAFLMGHNSRREGERVTAYELSLDVREMENSLGGQYTVFGSSWQVPYSKLIMREVGLQLPKGSIEPEILTGLDAFARAGDLELVRSYTEAMEMPAMWDEEYRQKVDIYKYSDFVASSLGLKISWEKTDEQMQKEAEARQKADEAAMVAEEGAKATPDIIKAEAGVS